LAVRRDEHREALRHPHLPPAVMDEAVVVRADEHAVLQARFPSVGPVHRVMPLAPAWWASAFREGASLVPYAEGSADRAAAGASFASDVEHLVLAVEDDGYY